MFPQFDIDLQPNAFVKGDDVTDGYNEGTVYDWNDSNKQLIVEASNEFEVGKVLTADATGAKGLIKENISFISKYNFDYFSIVDNGWEYLTGFLNNELQKIIQVFVLTQ